MLFSKGFLGTDAPLYMDIATIYFAILPFLLAFSIFYAVKKQYKKHFISQFIILSTTLYIVVLFEIGLRISGGFMEYSKYSNISFDFMLVFLIIHIFIAIAAIAGWIFLFISSYKQYKRKNKSFFYFITKELNNPISPPKTAPQITSHPKCSFIIS